MPAAAALTTPHDDFFRRILAPDCPNCGANPCYFICPNSPRYYSAEQERADSDFNDSLSNDQWFSMAAAQYERVHGEPYCS